MIARLGAASLITGAALAASATAAPVGLFCTGTNVGITTTFRLDPERGTVLEGFIGSDPRPLPVKNAPLTSTDRSLAWQWQYKGHAPVHFEVDRITLAAHSWSLTFHFRYQCNLLRQQL
jgi:hypothetical protein